MTLTPATMPPKSSGRPPGSKSMRTKAARIADKSLSVLESVQEDAGAPHMARVLAAQTILALAGLPVSVAIRGRE